MKAEFNRKVNFIEVDPEFVISLNSLVKMLQEAAIDQSKLLFVDRLKKLEEGSVWIMYRYGIEIFHWPLYEEELKIVTWANGYKGYKTFRKFEIYSGDLKIASASAVYLYYDLVNKKLKKIPKKNGNIYEIENYKEFNDELDQWKPVAKFNDDFNIELTTRLSDFDAMGHVNNTVYFDYIETMLYHFLQSNEKPAKIKIQYTKEIDKSVKKLNGGIQRNGSNCKYKFYDQNRIFAHGEIEFKE